MNSKLPPKSPKCSLKLVNLDKNSATILLKTQPKRELLPKSSANLLSSQKNDHYKTLTPSPLVSKEKTLKTRRNRVKNDQKLYLDPFLHRNIAKRSKSEQNLERPKQLQEILKTQTKPVKSKMNSNDQEIKEFNKNIKELRTLFGKKKHSEFFLYEKVTNKKKPRQTSKKPSKIVKNMKKTNLKSIKPLQIPLVSTSNHSDMISMQSKSAIKIQSCFRGYIIRKLFKTCLKYLEPLKTNENSSFSFSYIQNSIEAYIDPGDIPTPSFYSKSFTEASAATRLKILIHKKSVLNKLEAEDLSSIQEILKSLNYNQEIFQVFIKVIRRRYQKLHEFFDKWLKKLREALKYLIYIESSTQSIHLSRKEINQRVRNPSEELCSDIEHLWEKIEDFQVQKSRNFLSNFASSLHTFHIIDQTELRVSSHGLADSLSDSTIMTFSKPESTEPLIDLSDHSKESIQKSHEKVSFINVVQGSSSMSLENSKALKDYSSIQNIPDEGQFNETSSLQNDLDLKPRPSPRQTMWPSKSRSIFDCESASNPLSGTSHLERQYDASEVNLVVDRTLINLEFIIFHEIIEDHDYLFQDTQFVLRLSEEVLLKLVSKFIAEAVRPRVVRQSTQPQVKTDTLTLLKHLDVVFTNNLENLLKFQEKLGEIFGYEAVSIQLRTDSRYLPGSRSLFTLKSKTEGLIAIHQKAIIQACSELLVHKIQTQKSSLFDLVLWKIPALRLADLLVEVRDTLENWNEVKSGTLPLGDTIRPNGELDEVKLFSRRKESLNLMIFEEILSEHKSWTEYFFEEEQEILKVEESIFKFLLEEQVILLKTL